MSKQVTKIIARQSNKLVLATIFYLFALKNISAQENLTSFFHKKIDSVVNNAVRLQAFPGAVILAYHKDSLFFQNAYGYHTYDSMRKMELHHIFDLASITKVSASTLALMKLYEDQLIELDKPLKNYISKFKYNKTGNATLRELLSHQAGWKSWIPYYQAMKKKNGEWSKRYFVPEQDKKHNKRIHDSLYMFNTSKQFVYRKIRKAPVSSEHKFIYSDLFFYLVPDLVNRLTDTTFEQYLYHHFYDPLNTATTGFNPILKFQDSLIVPTEVDTFFRKMRLHGQVHDEGAIFMDGISGHAGLFSNAKDLASIWLMLLNEGIKDNFQYLKPQTVQLFTTTQYPQNDNRRALGFDKPLLIYDNIKSTVAKTASFRSFGHTGFTGTFVWADPENESLIIILCNRVYPSRNQRAIYELNVRPAIQSIIYDWIDKIEIGDTTEASR